MSRRRTVARLERYRLTERERAFIFCHVRAITRGLFWTTASLLPLAALVLASAWAGPS